MRDRRGFRPIVSAISGPWVSGPGVWGFSHADPTFFIQTAIQRWKWLGRIVIQNQSTDQIDYADTTGGTFQGFVGITTLPGYATRHSQDPPNPLAGSPCPIPYQRISALQAVPARSSRKLRMAGRRTMSRPSTRDRRIAVLLVVSPCPIRRDRLAAWQALSLCSIRERTILVR